MVVTLFSLPLSIRSICNRKGASKQPAAWRIQGQKENFASGTFFGLCVGFGGFAQR